MKHTHIYEMILQGLGEGVMMEDAEGRFVFVNDVAARMAKQANAAEFMDAARGQIRAQFDVTDEHGRSVARDDLPSTKVFKSRVPERMLMRVRDLQTGDVSWRNVKSLPVIESDGSMQYCISIWEDVTEARKQSELRIAQAHRLNSAVAAFSRALTPNDVAECLIQYVIEHYGAYAGFVMLFDETRTDLNTISISGFPKEIAFQLSRVSIDSEIPPVEAVKTGKPIWLNTMDEFRARYPKWELGPFSITKAIAAVPLNIGDRTIGAAAFAFLKPREFADDERAELLTLAAQSAQAVERANLYKEAHEAIAVREEFLSVASHELKTPLTTLVLQISRLQKLIPDPKLDLLRRQVWRLTALVENLLDVTRITNNRLGLMRERFELGEMLEDIRARFADQAAAAGVTIQLDAREKLEGNWDRLRLEQLATNLISNALKYGGGAGTSVRVVIERSGPKQARLAVTDQGQGIAAEDLTRIFNRFERLAKRESPSGLGLGLYIARGIVESHGGRIWVESALNGGSTFNVELPLE